MTSDQFFEDMIFTPGHTQEDLAHLLTKYAFDPGMSPDEQKMCIVLCISDAVQRELLSPSFIKYVSEYMATSL